MAKEAVIKAVNYVDDYIREQTIKALVLLDKEAHGKGCGCSNCAKIAVRNANYWIEDAMGDPDAAINYQASVVLDGNGKVKILMGYNFLDDK